VSVFCYICICYLDVNWLIPNISACRARIWSLVASERNERVTNFIFCRAGWYDSVSIVIKKTMNIIIKRKFQQSKHLYKPVKMNGIFANYLWTMFWGSVFWIFWIMWFFPRKYKYRCIRVYVWFKGDKHVISVYNF
jgi:hypothetical protein